MSKHETSKALKELRLAIESLQVTPEPFNQEERAARARSSDEIFKRAYSTFKSAGDCRAESEEVLQSARDLCNKCQNEAFPPDFSREHWRVANKDLAGLETLVRFLEDDPWFFRSGYVKTGVIKSLRRIDLPGEYKSRLQTVVENAILKRDRREFKDYCELARKVDDANFRVSLERFLSHEDPNVRRRAKWVLDRLKTK